MRTTVSCTAARTVCVKSYLLILVLLYQGDCVVCGSRHVTMYRIIYIYQVTTHRVDDARRTLGEREGRYPFLLDTVSLISSRLYHTVYGKGGRGDDGDASLQRPVPIDTSRVALLHFVLRAH